MLKGSGLQAEEELPNNSGTRKDLTAAWLVHLLTASGGVLGLFSLYAIHRGWFPTAFLLMATTIVIDSIDGTLARKVGVKALVPGIDGSLLDNLVDYLNYVLVPAFFILVADLLPYGAAAVTAGLITIASAYQFSQCDAKTGDHFFKGFPSYWNIVIFYLFLWQTHPVFNLFILLVLVPLVFVPIKYVHLLRLEHVTRHPVLKKIILCASVVFAGVNIVMFSIYPDTNRFLVVLSVTYIALYATVSLYRTFVPLGLVEEHGVRGRPSVPFEKEKPS